jgi:hypothetical protein
MKFASLTASATGRRELLKAAGATAVAAAMPRMPLAATPAKSFRGRILAFSTILNAARYVLVARGIFKEDMRSRPTPGMGDNGGGGGSQSQGPLSEADKKVVRDALNTYLKEYLRG